MNTTDVEAPDLGYARRQRDRRVDVAHEQNPDAGVRLPTGEQPARLLDRRENHLDLRRHTHAIEVLLPIAIADLVIDEHDERHMERLPPSYDDLTMDQAVIDAVERQAHGVTRMALAPASTARRAASAGEMLR